MNMQRKKSKSITELNRCLVLGSCLRRSVWEEFLLVLQLAEFINTKLRVSTPALKQAGGSQTYLSLPSSNL